MKNVQGAGNEPIKNPMNIGGITFSKDDVLSHHTRRKISDDLSAVSVYTVETKHGTYAYSDNTKIDSKNASIYFDGNKVNINNSSLFYLKGTKNSDTYLLNDSKVDVFNLKDGKSDYVIFKGNSEQPDVLINDEGLDWYRSLPMESD